MLRTRFVFLILALCVALCGAPGAGQGEAFAAVTAEEAAMLRTSLTPFGAERAANKEGSIPAWEGGYTKVPEGYKSGQPRPDPFAGEKPLFSIDGKNVEQHAGKLAEGVTLMLKKYPSFRADVYPTHRTAAAPQWVYDNTLRNATRAVTEDNGLLVKGAYGGIPFPIPKDGYEVMWNHLLAWFGESIREPFQAYIITATGDRIASVTEKEIEYPYYYRNGSAETFSGDYYLLRLLATAPPFRAGESVVIREPIDYVHKSRQAWQYLTGQRRVRRSPTYAYDSPTFGGSGITNVDESVVFNGAMDRYQMKLVGKREMYIPYNNNRFHLQKALDVVGTQYLNPDFVRWELHRVWVVEATLAPGKRHVVPRRRFYVDEDSWHAVIVDEWDAQGQLWKLVYGLPFVAYEVPAVIAHKPFVVHNVQTGAYEVNDLMNEMPVQFQIVPRKPEGYFTPENMAGTGVR